MEERADGQKGDVPGHRQRPSESAHGEREAADTPGVPAQLQPLARNSLGRLISIAALGVGTLAIASFSLSSRVWVLQMLRLRASASPKLGAIREPVSPFDDGDQEKRRTAMGRIIGGAACVMAMCVATFSGRSILERIDTTISHLGTANQQLRIANTQLALANQRLAEMQVQIGEANQRLDATEGHVKTANVQLREAMTALGQTNAKMSAMNAKLGFIDRVVGKIPLLGPVGHESPSGH
jgi:hypothetical protein